MAYEEVEVTAGSYIGWGNKKGQHVTGKVVDYEEHGGKDYDSNPCPLLEIQLTERAASFNKQGDRTDYDKGDVVLVTCGQANLKKKVKRAELKRGDMVKIVLNDFVKVSDGVLKEFGVLVDRSASSSSVDDDDEPPF